MKRLLCALLLLTTGLAEAHKPSDSYLQLQTRSDSTAITGRWDIALRDLNLVLPVDANRDGQITWGELQRQQPALVTQVLSTLTVHAMADGQASVCPMMLTGLQVNEHVDGSYAALHLQGNCSINAESLEIDYQFLFHRDPDHHGLLRLDQDDTVLTATFSNAERRQQLSRDSRWQAFQGFIVQGIHHILIGYDHILFLLTLLFPAVLVWRTGGWQPAPSMTTALWQTLSIVTAFTLTHSLTLALATLGIISLPSWLVESAIAATVALGAVANLLPRLFPKRWVMAFVFGLIHGMGFASVLADLGLTDSGVFLPLLGFNLGVELGQVAIVLVFVPVAYLLRQTHFYQRVFVPVGSLSIMLLAGVWLVERLG
ncbi:MAG: HupE/UreJ family protein [Pseudomonadota bacterium]|uniref:HupE/UreJ family protein n=1 Tax=Alcanivorax sp. TaxID=1872427 RepID=UPI0025C36F62|nr:HupE/UreJ family protein [Alcanivorax sp.]MEE3319987.1 HupE/UreJ family protein [Pseudomonadota bacterium]